MGANLAAALATRHPDRDVVALDNLRRRGSELNLHRLREAGVRFVHGDVRELGDLMALEPVDAVVECSAEPSVMAGLGSDIGYLVGTNLLGAYHCLELARRDSAQLVFLSTSRIYPVAALNSLAYEEEATRFALVDGQPVAGASAAGISERFPLEGARTLYGATKLSAEILIAEYVAAFGVDAVIDRCGVIAGPWQMGKVDQGVLTHWVLSHYLRRDLAYIGFGGRGKQVRDALHVDDLVDLIDRQLAEREGWAGVTVNVGGETERSVSLVEMTKICQELTGNSIDVRRTPATRPGDIPIYISDCADVRSRTDWRPQRSIREILEDIFDWVHVNERAVVAALG